MDGNGASCASITNYEIPISHHYFFGSISFIFDSTPSGKAISSFVWGRGVSVDYAHIIFYYRTFFWILVCISHLYNACGTPGVVVFGECGVRGYIVFRNAVVS